MTAAVTAALAVAALAGPGQAAGEQVTATFKRVGPVVVKPVVGTPVGDTGTSIKAKGSSWAMPAATTSTRGTISSLARGSSWS